MVRSPLTSPWWISKDTWDLGSTWQASPLSGESKCRLRFSLGLRLQSSGLHLQVDGQTAMVAGLSWTLYSHCWIQTSSSTWTSTSPQFICWPICMWAESGHVVRSAQTAKDCLLVCVQTTCVSRGMDSVLHRRTIPFRWNGWIRSQFLPPAISTALWILAQCEGGLTTSRGAWTSTSPRYWVTTKSIWKVSTNLTNCVDATSRISGHTSGGDTCFIICWLGPQPTHISLQRTRAMRGGGEGVGGLKDLPDNRRPRHVQEHTLAKLYEKKTCRKCTLSPPRGTRIQQFHYGCRECNMPLHQKCLATHVQWIAME